MKRRGNYRRNFSQRFGTYSESTRSDLGKGRIWLHAVSVGECNVALTLIDHLRQKRPESRFVLTVNTSTGYAMAEKRKHPDDILLYPPVDLPHITRRAIAAIQPACLCLIETEVWPNLLRTCRSNGVPTVLVNGRLSDRTTARLERVPWLTRRVYGLVDLFCMQSDEDRERIVRLGAAPERVRTQHTAKYDLPERNPEKEAAARQDLQSIGFLKGKGRQPLVLMGSSTWPGEEAALCRALLSLRATGADVNLLLVPRHAERTPEILEELAAFDLTIACRYSVGKASGRAVDKPDVFILNSTGELRDFTAVADWVFVGKSLTRQEGQNPLEAAEMGKAVITGTGMNNFRSVMADMRAANAVCEVMDEQALIHQLVAWTEDSELPAVIGRNAAQLVRSRRGVLKRTAELILQQI